jgi:hypothetical protein
VLKPYLASFGRNKVIKVCVKSKAGSIHAPVTFRNHLSSMYVSIRGDLLAYVTADPGILCHNRGDAPEGGVRSAKISMHSDWKQ